MYFLGFNWNPNETLFELGFIQIKYYNLLWITAFVVGFYIMKKIFKNENKSLEKLDSLFVYAVVSIMLGARLGHVLFYQSELFSDDPLSILLPIRTVPKFEFTGFAGLASHGAAIAAIFALYLFARKYKDISFMWILDRVTITCAIGAIFIRLGNFFNSEINGKVVDGSFALATRFIRDSDDMPAYKAMQVTSEKTASAAYKALENNTEYASILETIPYRHPVQLYEAFLYLILFGIMYFVYWKTDKRDKPGFLFGVFMLGLWTARFVAEYYKKSQGGFEDTWGTFTTGQWLSIPMILVGLYFMLRPTKEVVK
jgi:prolipoprotein diacylglyceryl transferase